MELNLLQTIAVYALPVVFAITLHEAAHGYVAKHFGDLTAYAEGRVSLNPLRHIDPVGTVALPLALLALSKLFTGGGILLWIAAIVMASSELPELLAMCDRILVLCEGRITAELTRDEATQERIMTAATARRYDLAA